MEYLITKSILLSSFVILIVAFLESLALVGLLLPGTILMVGIGMMIGNGNIKLYPAWFAGTIGCLLGDWLSYYVGWKFKEFLSHWRFLKKYKSTLNKIKYALYQHNIITIIFGRFIGYTRPLIPLISGMVSLPIKKFFLANAIACFFWPLLYFIPGILAGVISEIPNTRNTEYLIFKILLLIIIIIFWIGVWLCWRWKNTINYDDWLQEFLPIHRLRWLAPTFFLLGMIGIIAIQFHPMMKLFHHVLKKIFIHF